MKEEKKTKAHVIVASGIGLDGSQVAMVSLPLTILPTKTRELTTRLTPHKRAAVIHRPETYL